MAQNNRKTGTGFTNISKYLGANEGNKLGSTIGAGITEKSQEAKDKAGSVSSGFQTKANEGRVGTEEDQDKLKDIGSKFDATEQSGFYSGTEGANDLEQDKSTVSGFLTGQYKGPKDIADKEKEDLRASSQALSSLAGSTRSAGGREALLSKFVGAGNEYGSGNRNFDNLLLGKTGGSNLEQARRQANTAVGSLGNISEGSKLLGSQYEQEAKNFADSTRDQFQGIGTGINENIDEAARARTSALVDIRDSERTAETAQKERDALRALGIEDYDHLYGSGKNLAVDAQRDPLTGDLNIGAEDRAYVRTDIQAAKLQALNDLVSSDHDTRRNDDAVLNSLKEQIGSRKNMYDRDVADLQSTELSGHIDLYRSTPGYEQGRTLGDTSSGSNSSPYFRAKQDTIAFLQDQMGYPSTYNRGGIRVADRSINSLSLKQIDQMKQDWDAKTTQTIQSNYGIY